MPLLDLTDNARSGLVFNNGAMWCKMVYNIPMATITEKTVRKSVTLPPPVAKRVTAMAKSQKVSSNRILVELVETGLRSKDEEKRRFMELAERLSTSKDPQRTATIERRACTDDLRRISAKDPVVQASSCSA